MKVITETRREHSFWNLRFYYFIRYDQSQKLWKPNNLKVFGSKTIKEPKHDLEKKSAKVNYVCERRTIVLIITFWLA